MSELSVPETTSRPEEESTAETPLWEYLHVLLQRRWLILAIFGVVTTQAVVRTNLVQPIYRGVAQLLIERQAPSVLAFKEVTEVNAGWWGEEYFQTQYRVLQSRALARRVIEDMKLYNEPEFGGPRTAEQVKAMAAAAPGESPAMEGLIGAFLGRVSINPIKDSRVVAVGFDSARPDLAARVANRLCQLYMQQSLDFRYQTSAEAGEWLGGQVDDQRKKVEAAELALEKVREDGGIVNIEERRTLLNQKLTQLGSALTELKTQRIEKQTLFEQMRRAAHPEDLPDVAKSPLVQAQLMELANLERRESQLLETYLDQHPEVIQVRSQIREAKEKIRAEAARVVRGAESDYQAAAAQEANVVGGARSHEGRPRGSRASSDPLRHEEAGARRSEERARQPAGAPQGDRRLTGAQVHQHPDSRRRRDPRRAHSSTEDARHPERDPPGAGTRNRIGVLPRIPRQHPEDSRRRQALSGRAFPWRRARDHRQEDRAGRRPPQERAGTVRRGIPHREDGPALLLARPREPRDRGHLDGAGGGQDPDVGEPGHDDGGPRRSGAADRRGPAQAQHPQHPGHEEEPGALRRARGEAGAHGRRAADFREPRSSSSRPGPTCRARRT